jgi:thioredoxin reductase (NADPH)
MLGQLCELQNELNFSIDVCDVDTNNEWYLRFNTLVPVLMNGDIEICRYYLDKIALEKALV